MNGYSFWITFIVFSVVGFLIWAADRGSLVATAVLSVLATTSLILVGVFIATKIIKVMQDKSQADFVANAQENQAIMQQTQKAQNLQSRMVLDQISTVARLPERTTRADYNEILDIDNDVFSELED